MSVVVERAASFDFACDCGLLGCESAGVEFVGSQPFDECRFADWKAGDQPKAMTPMTPAITRALAAYSLRS